MNNNLNELIELKNYINYLIEMVLTENPYNLNAMGIKHVADYNKPSIKINHSPLKLNYHENPVDRGDKIIRPLHNPAIPAIKPFMLKIPLPDYNKPTIKTPQVKEIPYAKTNTQPPIAIKNWREEHDKNIKFQEEKKKQEQLKLLSGGMNDDSKNKFYDAYQKTNNKENSKESNPLYYDNKIREKKSDENYEIDALKNYYKKYHTRHPLSDQHVKTRENTKKEIKKLEQNRSKSELNLTDKFSAINNDFNKNKDIIDNYKTKDIISNTEESVDRAIGNIKTKRKV